MLKIQTIRFVTNLGTQEQVSEFFDRETGGYVPELMAATATELVWSFDASFAPDFDNLSELFGVLEDELAAAPAGWAAVGNDHDDN